MRPVGASSVHPAAGNAPRPEARDCRVTKDCRQPPAAHPGQAYDVEDRGVRLNGPICEPKRLAGLPSSLSRAAALLSCIGPGSRSEPLGRCVHPHAGRISRAVTTVAVQRVAARAIGTQQRLTVEHVGSVLHSTGPQEGRQRRTAKERSARIASGPGASRRRTTRAAEHRLAKSHLFFAYLAQKPQPDRPLRSAGDFVLHDALGGRRRTETREFERS